jgi:hypothetical protein
MNSVADDKGLNLGVFGNLLPNSGSGLTFRVASALKTRCVSKVTVYQAIPEWMFTVYAEQKFRIAASEYMVQFFFI